MAVFVVQFAALLFVVAIAPALTARSGTLVLVENRDPRFSWAGPGLSIRADRASPEGLRRYRPILLQELSRYDAVITSLPLRQIVLSSGLTMNGEPVGGLTVQAAGTIFLDVGPPGPVDERLVRRAIHHELFHIIDGVLSANTESTRTWTRLNPTDFAYGGDEILRALETISERSDQRTEVPGLLNYYAMVNVREDRAEVFASLMVSPEELAMLAAEDGILAAKIAHLKRELLGLGRNFASIIKYANK